MGLPAEPLFPGRRWSLKLGTAFALLTLDSFCHCLELRAHQLHQKDLERLDLNIVGKSDADRNLDVFLRPRSSNALPVSRDGEDMPGEETVWFLRRPQLFPHVFGHPSDDPPSRTPYAPEGGKDLVNGIAGIGRIGAIDGENAAEIVGIHTNKAGDLAAFSAALIGNGIFIIIIFLGFEFHLRRYYPDLYQYNANSYKRRTKNNVPELTDRYFSWLVASWRVTVDEVATNVGLDSAMLLDFTHMSMKVFAILSAPMIVVMCPLDAIYGGGAAGEDSLSIPSMNNIQQGSWLYWIYPFVVWGVVYVVTEFIFHAKSEFLERRHTFLREMKLPRATTIMVEGIPPEYQTNRKLRSYFQKMFGLNKVREAFVVKSLRNLEKAKTRKTIAERGLVSTGFQLDTLLDTLADVDQIRSTLTMENTNYERDQVEADQEIEKEWKIAQEAFETPGGINTSTGFVTFSNRRVREVALLLNSKYSVHSDQWEVSVPPTPKAINWGNLKMPIMFKATWGWVGILLLLALGIFYLPIVLYISVGCASINMGWLEPVWDAFAPSAGLTIMVSMLPWCFGWVARKFFPLKDDGMFQETIQRWGFVFQTLFVILVPAIGSSITSFIERVVRSPLSIFTILSSTMPSSTHFYMNYVMLQMTFQVLNLWRYMNLGRYWTFRTLYPPKDARKYSEPEDQDYCGIGNRCANFVLFFNIGIVFGTICPFILLETILMFAMCRLTYGYLVVYAETKKPDVGGNFWERQMSHLLIGLAIYTILMTGMFLQYAPNVACGVIALPSFFYVWWSFHCYHHDFNWRSLPWEQVVEHMSEIVEEESSPLAAKELEDTTYEQPDITETRREIIRESSALEARLEEIEEIEKEGAMESSVTLFDDEECVCGNVFYNDSGFCRKCGRPRPSLAQGAGDESGGL